MSALSHVVRGPARGPVRVVIHGDAGVGKTTWAAGARKPLFVQAEDGTGALEFDRITPNTWQAYLNLLDELIHDKHDYATLVIDSADWLERLAEQSVCAAAKVDSLEEVGGGFGKGAKQVAENWFRMLQLIDAGIVRGRKMHVVFIAHSEPVTFRDPDGADYLRWSLKCGKAVSGLLREWPDFLLYASIDRDVRKGKVDARREPRRVLATEAGFGFEAKSRLPLPAELPLSWAAFGEAVSAAWKKAHPTVEAVAVDTNDNKGGER